MARSLAGRAARRAAWKIFPNYMEKRAAVPFFPKIKETGVAFIHIPKAAGMSLSEAIYGEQVGHLKWHHVHASNPAVYDKLIKFAVCREPIERAASAFHFLKQGGINEADARFSREVLEGLHSFEEFALALGSPVFLSKVQRKVHFQSQHDFVCDRNGTIMVDHLVAIDRLEDDVPSILSDDQCGEIPHKNRTSGGSKTREPLSETAEANLRRVYQRDFDLMNFVRGPEPVRGLPIGGPSA